LITLADSLSTVGTCNGCSLYDLQCKRSHFCRRIA